MIFISTVRDTTAIGERLFIELASSLQVYKLQEHAGIKNQNQYYSIVKGK